MRFVAALLAFVAASTIAKTVRGLDNLDRNDGNVEPDFDAFKFPSAPTSDDNHASLDNFDAFKFPSAPNGDEVVAPDHFDAFKHPSVPKSK
ncbi:Aste57867_5246 [Aphanomyces stellatus]|uniref:Aste57867_5246 protein n=1 Tax=Aphanomyces stellatus TaxID=120398 RepID=A0A485KCP2_9STRA|nr:hypothetical protein As57867_005233 [Aphanomyces stellatus]VFT82319.1 Aste57867_5246 [Aphanomyces stellatus]